MSRMQAWKMHRVAEPMRHEVRPLPELGPGEVLVRVAGCGVCHTDLGFFYDGVRTIQPCPLTLGHEISGFVEQAGAGFESWAGRAVIVPAVLPCGECELCRKGRGTICRTQKMPGNHIDGGFASHVVVPGLYLCPVDVEDEASPFGNSGVSLRELSVVADAVTTPFQAIRNSGLRPGELAIFIGVGGIGGFGVQIATAMGASVVAIDIDRRRLEMAAGCGAGLTINPEGLDKKEIRAQIRGFVSERSLSPFEWKIFEASGTKAGQQLAFGLLTFGAALSVVGFTMERLQLRLSNLMAFDARAIGNWGCHPDHYPEVLELVRRGEVKLKEFVEAFPLSQINSVFQRVHDRELIRRPVLVPDFD